MHAHHPTQGSQGLEAKHDTPQQLQRVAAAPPGGGRGSPVPPEVSRGWNWGGFFLGPLWAIFNRVWIGLLGFLPLLGLLMAFVLGARGNEWAWQKKPWRSVEHFKRVQKRWGFGGAAIFIVSIPLAISAGWFVEEPIPTGDPGQLNVAISSHNGRFLIWAPEGWTKDDTLSEEADLGASDHRALEFAIIIAEPISQLQDMSLEKYATLTRSFLTEDLEDATQSVRQKVIVDAQQALQYEVMGRVEGEALAYLFTVVEGKDHMYQVIAWTSQSEWDAKEELLREVTSRVEELPGGPIG